MNRVWIFPREDVLAALADRSLLISRTEKVIQHLPFSVKEKSGVKKGKAKSAIKGRRGGGVVRRLMAKVMKNDHFLFSTSLSDLIDVTLAWDDANSKLVEVLLLLMLMLRDVLTIVWCRF